MTYFCKSRAVQRALLVVLVSLFSGLASAANVQKIVSKRGITAWLVEDHSVPVMSLEFAFRGGTAQDPAGKEGAALLMASLLNEGAEGISSVEFQKEVQSLALTLGFSANKDTVSGSLRTLTRNRARAAELMALALQKPSFIEQEIDQQKVQILASIKADEQDNNAIASKLWMEKAFAGHPYARPSKGTPDSIKNLTRTDVMDRHQALLARSNLVVSAVGDLRPDELAVLLDQLFAPLPAQPRLSPMASTEPRILNEIVVVPVSTPQTVIQFGGAAMKIDDPDFIPAMVLNHILGGGSFSSRLYTQVREKRGLTYGVYTGLNPLEYAGLFIGSLSTRNEKAGEAHGLILDEIRRLRDEGPQEQELEDAKSYLIGSYVLGMDSSQKIAARLQGIQLGRFDIEYINKRADIIAKIKMADVRRVANRFLSGHYLTIMVGQPVGVSGARPAP